MNPTNQTSGFWFAYIEAITCLAVIFIILFFTATSRQRVINEQQERLVKSWESAKNRLDELHAKPVLDSSMGGMRITLADSLIFSINSSELSDRGREMIERISRVLVDFYRSNLFFRNAIRLKIGGHTDRIGGDEINFPLSYQRASNVTNIIQGQFIQNDLQDVKIIPIAYGSNYPLPGCDNEIEPRNRRITIVVELLSTELLTIMR